MFTGVIIRFICTHASILHQYLSIKKVQTKNGTIKLPTHNAVEVGNNVIGENTHAKNFLTTKLNQNPICRRKNLYVFFEREVAIRKEVEQSTEPSRCQ